MKPFCELVRERAADPQKAALEAVERLRRWRMLSGSKMVSLDEVAWFGAVFALAGVEAASQMQKQDSPLEVKTEGNVTTVIATDGCNRVKDGVAT